MCASIISESEGSSFGIWLMPLLYASTVWLADVWLIWAFYIWLKSFGCNLLPNTFELRHDIVIKWDWSRSKCRLKSWGNVYAQCLINKSTLILSSQVAISLQAVHCTPLAPTEPSSSRIQIPPTLHSIILSLFVETYLGLNWRDS